MEITKEILREHVCYTDLVYGRVNKKLDVTLANPEIEQLVQSVIANSNKIEKIGKNYYVNDSNESIQLTINSYNYRLITVTRL